MSLASDIATVLVAAGLGTVGADIFYGPERATTEIGDGAIFVLEGGGFAPTPMLGGSDADDLKTIDALIVVRSDKNDFEGGETTAQAAWTALHKQNPAAWISWVITTSGPAYVGSDETGRHRWTLTLLAQVLE